MAVINVKKFRDRDGHTLTKVKVGNEVKQIKAIKGDENVYLLSKSLLVNGNFDDDLNGWDGNVPPNATLAEVYDGKLHLQVFDPRAALIFFQNITSDSLYYKVTFNYENVRGRCEVRLGDKYIPVQGTGKFEEDIKVTANPVFGFRLIFQSEGFFDNITVEVVEAPKEHQIVVNFYTAPWCGPCQGLEKTMRDYVKTHPTVTYNEFNVDEIPEENVPSFVTSVPTIQILQDGVETNIIRKTSSFELTRLLNKLL